MTQNSLDTAHIYNMIPPEKGVVDMYVKIYPKSKDRWGIIIPAKYSIRKKRVLLSSVNGDLLDSKHLTYRRAAEIDLAIEKSSIRKINGELYRNNGLQFYDFLQTWLATKENDAALSEGTKGQYRTHVKKIMSHIENIDIRCLDNYEIVKFMGKIKGADSYRSTIRNVLADIFSCACSWHGIRKPEIPTVKVATKTKTILTEGQINLVLSRAGVDYEIWRTLFNTGMRQGEIFALRFPNLELKKKIVHVRENYYKGSLGKPKGKNERRVRLDIFDSLVPMLERIKKEAKDKESFVFLNKLSRIYTSDNLWKSWRRMRKGITSLGIHDATRATFICRCLDMGMNHRAVMAQVGHVNFKTLERYLNEVDIEKLKIVSIK